MNNGKEFNISNFWANNIKDWIRTVLMPQGVQLLWSEIVPGNFVQVSQIQEIREMTKKDLEEIGKPEGTEDEGDDLHDGEDNSVPEDDNN